jgi:hypothetical protein
MKQTKFVSTAILFLFLWAAIPGGAQSVQQKEDHGKSGNQANGKGQSKGNKEQGRKQEKAVSSQATHGPKDQIRTGQQQHGQPPRGRLSQERQQQLIREQQQQIALYRQRLDQQQSAARQYEAQLQQSKRVTYYRIQRDYSARLRQQQIALQRSFDYNNDPYFYTAPTYRYLRSGTYYQVNEYGAQSLKQAVNYGYSEGFRAGQADREDHWRFDFQNSYAYRDANYGYDGYYGDQENYNYYFRQGFQKGYDDGYYSRAAYGEYANGSYTILSGILSQVLNLQALR